MPQGSPIGGRYACHLRCRPVLHQHRVSYEADGEAFDFERFAGFDDDGGVIRIFGMQLDQVLVAPEAFDGDFIAQPRNDDLPVLRFLG